MGSRKRLAAEQAKENRKSVYFAKLNNVPTSPRKMRIVADMVRGLDVVKASYMLKYSTKEASNKLEKLLYSAINNFEQKTGENWEDAGLVISEIKVDGGRQLKRIQPAPQGRAHRIRKRSNHVTLVLSKSNNN